MKTVELSHTVRPSYDDIMSCLSPKDIVEYTELFDIVSHENVNGADHITVSFEDDEMELKFFEIDSGYEYTLVESSGLFAERHSKITVSDGSETVVSARTEYTLDTRWSFVMDWLATPTVRQELEIMTKNLVFEAAEAESGTQ